MLNWRGLLPAEVSLCVSSDDPIDPSRRGHATVRATGTQALRAPHKTADRDRASRPGKRGAHFRALAKLLAIVDKFRKKEHWIRTFYNDIWKLREVLFAEGRTTKGAKRLMREMTRSWEKRLRRLDSDDPGAGVLSQWLKQTESHWPGLFHCYADPRIPHTNNEGEQLILVVKNAIRRLANNPNPAVRVMRSGAVTALFVGRAALPGEAFVASCSAETCAKADKLLKAQRRKIGVMQRSRRDFDGELRRAMERVRKASRAPPKSIS